MGINRHPIIYRFVSLGLVCCMLTVESSAIVKEVSVWGARSINNEGYSDNRVSLEEIEKDYADFVQTDGLREYFYKEQEAPAKVDMTEAASWLIDNEIICRDRVISVTGFDGSGVDRIPRVEIQKEDLGVLSSKIVTRSDAIMYIYKAVFGPIDARTIGLETDNIRVDDGERKTLYKMMEDHDYFTTINNTPNSIVQNESTGGQQSVQQSCVTTQNGHYDSQTVNSNGGIAGQQTIGYAENINSSATWRYTPQGAKFESVFGDTNIFISDINIAQQGNTGNGKQNIGIIDDNSKDGTDGNIAGPSQDTIYNQTSPTQAQDANHNAQQSEWAGTGGLNQGIAIESDYKNVYYVPGADLMFYRTNDVLELYIRAALSKGLLDYDKGLRTEDFNKTFINDINKNIADSWNPRSPAYIVNRNSNKLNTVCNVKFSKTQDILGRNFSVTYNTSNFNIQRVNLFAANSGYFTTERLYRMDIYRYIYTFISANEKKLSDLEAEIVNYKYGMELEGCTKNEDDKRIIMYLVAKGILNFDSIEDFSNLYRAISYTEFLPILYRVANINARLDFSKVQLTDSETSWRSKGYAPQSTYIVSGDTPSAVRFIMNPDLATDSIPVEEEEYPDNPVPMSSISIEYDSTGKTNITDDVASALIDTVVSRTIYSGDTEIHQVGLGAYELGEVTTEGNLEDLILYGGFCLDTAGLLVSTNPSDSKYVKTLIDNYVFTLSRTTLEAVKSAGDKSERANPNSNIRYTLINNLWAISLLRANPSSYKLACDTFDEHIKKYKDSYESTNNKMEGEIYRTLLRMKQELVANVSTNADGLTGPKSNSLKFSIVNPNSGNAETWTSILQGGGSSALDRAVYILNNVYQVAYTFTESDGQDRSVTINIRERPVIAADNNNIIFSGKSVTCVQSLMVESPHDSKDATQLAGNEMINAIGAATAQEVAANTGSRELQNSASIGNKVIQYVKGKEGFLAWSQVTSFNGTKVDTSDTIQIEKINDLLLYNKQTGTRALFSNENSVNAVALVGTSVVKGDSNLGVAFKDGDGVGAEYYYHIDAIRLLMNAKQESSVLSGLRGTALADTAIQNSLATVPLKTESGHTESSLVGLKVQISSNDNIPPAGINVNDKSSPYYNNTIVVDGTPPTRWGRYVSLSQANRAVNAISRKINYSLQNSDIINTGYALVLFEPVDITKTGTAKVTQGMSMQDILDAAVKPPESDAGLKLYNSNMELANAYANWIYGTTGKIYIKTGYLVPKAYFYYPVGGDPNNIPASVKGSLTDEQFRNISFSVYNDMSGNVCKVNEVPIQNDGRIDSKYRANYALSSDYRVMISGDRVYLSESLCSNLTYSNNPRTGQGLYVLNNNATRLASFAIGTQFTVEPPKNNAQSWAGAVKATVLETKSDGTIVCQLGPIRGTPLRFSSADVILDSSEFFDSNGKDLKVWRDIFIRDVDVNKLDYIKSVVIGSRAGLTYEGICENPMTSIDSSVNKVYNGSSLQILSTDGKLEQDYIIPNFADGLYSTWNVSKMYSKMQEDIGELINLNLTCTWVQFSFSAYDFTVKNGKLVASDASVSDFLSPSLFTNLNDLIIDEMMNVNNGAIPINEVPEGSLLKIGNGYYCSVGTADNREFVGYTHITESTMGAFTPHIQDIAKSFAAHYIRGGAQYINVTHFFSGCYQLPCMDRELTDNRRTALATVARTTLSSDNNSKICIFADGTLSNIFDAGSSANVGALLYTPASISFQNILMAYPSGSISDTKNSVEVYTICPNATNSVAGPFQDLPFFTDCMREAELTDITSKTLSATWQAFPGSSQIMQAFVEQFNDAFRGDVFTLARMLVFIILVWLVAASWLCYSFSLGNLMPIVDAIKYPTADRKNKGIDLFKVISLGTISIDTEFKLGRFIQYNLVLSILLCIVWKSGNISI